MAVNGEASWLINGRRKTIDRATPLLLRREKKPENPEKLLLSSPKFPLLSSSNKKWQKFARKSGGNIENNRRYVATVADGLGLARGIRNSTGVTGAEEEQPVEIRRFPRHVETHFIRSVHF